MILDLADVENPKPIGKWRPETYRPGRHIEFHSSNVVFLDRDIIITNPEALMPHCVAGPWYDSYVFDVSAKAHPQMISMLPLPVPPEAASH